MELMFLLGLVLSCLIVSLVAGAEMTINTEDDHVIIGPVENITAYLSGPTNIVVTWDPPPVYLVHDVVNATFDDPDVIVSKHRNGASSDLNVTNESYNFSNATGFLNSSEASEGNVTENGTATTVVPPLPSNSSWKCQPISFFNNYTVAMKTDLAISSPMMVVAFKDSIQKHDKMTVKIDKENQKMVSFSEGCITSYEILWEKSEAGSPVFNMSVLPTYHTANITGLEPKTRYKIAIKAVYVSGDEFENKPAKFFTTTALNESKACSCDMYGTISPNQGCHFNGTTSCTCKQGYQGIFCEHCAPGYYRTARHFPCHRCPCDVHSSRKSTCRLVEGFVRCDSCEVGYTGNTCHMCAYGFYRHNRHCVPCFCNGNTSPNASVMCLPTTGMCQNCRYNTTGYHCERCLHGYVGNAVTFKNCTKEEDVRAGSLHAMSSSAPRGVIAAIVITFIFVLLLASAILWFRRYYSKEKRKAFWTVEMKRDNDDVDFNSVHNDDAHLGDADDVDYFSKHGFSSGASKYSRLKEQA